MHFLIVADIGVHMDNWQDKTEWKDLWLLIPEQAPLLSGMTDKGRLGFAIQLCNSVSPVPSRD